MLEKMQGVFFDLDDTLINVSGGTKEAWDLTCFKMKELFSEVDIDPLVLSQRITKLNDAFWSNETTRPKGNVDFKAIRQELVSAVFAEFGLAHDKGKLFLIENYGKFKEQLTCVYPNVYETLQTLKDKGKKLVLITNGDGTRQREKLSRFNLAQYFDNILIEGELGFGKPLPQVYERAIKLCGIEACEACMVGDNYLWEVEAPIKYGLKAVWVNTLQKKKPFERTIEPDYIISNISELLDW